MCWQSGSGSEWRERAVAVGARGPEREGLLVCFVRMGET